MPPGSPDSPASLKADLRARYGALRDGLDPLARAAASALVQERVLALPEVQCAGTVHVYAAFRSEVETAPLFGRLHARGVRVAMPIVTGPGRLQHRLYAGPASLKPGRFGVLVPSGTPKVHPSVLDVVLVPALAVDRTGVRLGYGGGFYDRFLKQAAAFRVGLAFDALVVDRLPSEPHDARLDAVVTEAETIRFGDRNRN